MKNKILKLTTTTACLCRPVPLALGGSVQCTVTLTAVDWVCREGPPACFAQCPQSSLPSAGCDITSQRK